MTITCTISSRNLINITIWDRTRRVAGVSLVRTEAAGLIDLLGYHVNREDEGNWIEDEVNGLHFLSEGKWGEFAIWRQPFEIMIPYQQCGMLLLDLKTAYSALPADARTCVP